MRCLFDIITWLGDFGLLLIDVSVSEELGRTEGQESSRAAVLKAKTLVAMLSFAVDFFSCELITDCKADTSLRERWVPRILVHALETNLSQERWLAATLMHANTFKLPKQGRIENKCADKLKVTTNNVEHGEPRLKHSSLQHIRKLKIAQNSVEYRIEPYWFFLLSLHMHRLSDAGNGIEYGKSQLCVGFYDLWQVGISQMRRVHNFCKRVLRFELSFGGSSRLKGPKNGRVLCS